MTAPKKELNYLKRFERANSEASQHFEVVGDVILVEELKEEEVKSAGGIIIQGTKNMVMGLDADRPTFARVLQVGAGFYDEETGEDHPLGVEPGDIVLVGKHSLKRFSVFGKLVSYGQTDLGLTRESEIQIRWKGQAGFDAYFNALNAE